MSSPPPPTSSSSPPSPPPRIKNFSPKEPIPLDPPKDDPITVSQLSLHDGTHEGKGAWVGIKGAVFDVSGNKAYGGEGVYRVFAGKDSSRALAQSSLKPEDCRAEYEDLGDKEKTVLEEWFTFFSKRYNIVGRVVEG